jgi:hypothetical protein
MVELAARVGSAVFSGVSDSSSVFSGALTGRVGSSTGAVLAAAAGRSVPVGSTASVSRLGAEVGAAAGLQAVKRVKRTAIDTSERNMDSSYIVLFV